MKPKPMVLNAEQLEALALGGCFFGSGGGGTLISARNLLEHFQVGDFYPSTEVRVISPEEATEGDGVVVAYMGAPVQINSAKFPIGPAKAVEKVIQHLKTQGRQLTYLVPPESGALGFIVTCLVAAKYGLAVVDGDGAGRAVPSLPMLTFASAGVPPDPAFLVSQEGLTVELDVEAPTGRGSQRHQEDMATIVEHMLRPILAEPQFGQFGGLAIWIMDPPTLQRALKVKGTLSRALHLGQQIQRGEITTSAALLNYLNTACGIKAHALFQGTLQRGRLNSQGGFDLGRIEIQGPNSTAISLYQNESLIAWDSALNHPLATAPDSIAYFLENRSVSFASNGDLVAEDGSILPEFQGAPVTLIGLVADPSLRESKGPGKEGLILKSFMTQLQDMGYPGAYAPVEALASSPKNKARAMGVEVGS